MLLARLRWSAFGLRGRIVGAVLLTTAVSLGAAALVLLPRLEASLKNASEETLEGEGKGGTGDLRHIARINYWVIVEACVEKKGPVAGQAAQESNMLVATLGEISGRL